MITKRHRLYLKRYPARIARERRKRVVHARNMKVYKRVQIGSMRKLLERHIKSRGPVQKVRAGNKKTFTERIFGSFRKPTV